MKPIAIFRHAAADGPGSFADWVAARGLPQTLVRIDAGDAVPAGIDGFSGLVFMGGPMSVNDDLPWIGPELALVRAAVDRGVPVLGHCLGGQLMAKALGGTVGRNPVKEIGWGTVRIEPTPAAADWFGARREFLSFHWHGETFTVPPSAERIASSAHCANQAFALGPHLGMQCHVEMQPEAIRTWYRQGAAEIAAELANGAAPGVQRPAEMEIDIDARAAELRAIAWSLYDRWAQALAR